MEKKSVDFQRGELVGAARAVLTAYRFLARTEPGADAGNALCMLDELLAELIRLAGNSLQLRNDYGDSIQLAVLVIFMADGYVEPLI